VNVLADVGDEMAKRVAADYGGSDPADAADNIEEEIARIGHSRGARDGRTERSDDGDEARENHGTAAIFFVELVGPLEMAAAKKERVFAAVKGSAGGTADPVAHLVTGDGAKHNWEQQPLEGNNSRVGKNAGGD